MNYIIEARDLSLSYNINTPRVLDSINLRIEKGSIAAFAGLSGCGKSTLAFCLCGIIPKGLPGEIEGNVLIERKNISELSLPNLSQKIGMVFQEVDNQIFLPTVEAEIAFAPENLCYPYDEIEEIIERLLKTFNIGHLRHKNPAKLSGGEKQLVAIASVLSLNPEIIILDEVLSELDEDNKKLILDTIKIIKELGKTVIIIDHSIDNLMIADTIFLMSRGKIEERIEVDNHELLYDRLHSFFLQQ
ncbi:MAG: ABC transporter ATP-binding protein [Tissierellales bacterium]